MKKTVLKAIKYGRIKRICPEPQIGSLMATISGKDLQFILDRGK